MDILKTARGFKLMHAFAYDRRGTPVRKTYISFFLIFTFVTSVATAKELDPSVRDKIQKISSQILKSRANTKKEVEDDSKVLQQKINLLRIALDDALKSSREEEKEKRLQKKNDRLAGKNSKQNIKKTDAKIRKSMARKAKRVEKIEAKLNAITRLKKSSSLKVLKNKNSREVKLNKLVNKLEIVKSKMKKSGSTEINSLKALKSELVNSRVDRRMLSDAPTIEFVKTLQDTPPTLQP